MQPLLPRSSEYDSLMQGFAWDVPARLNMARQVCDDWAQLDPDRVAILDLSQGRQVISYGALRAMADRLAHQLRVQGVQVGDRVAVLRPQSAWTAAAHIAIWKLGAVSVPLFTLFGPDALELRLKDAGVRIMITDPTPPSALASWLAAEAGHCALAPETLPANNTVFDPVKTGPDDPAVLIYTSGTTGAPKGALHGHKILLGHLPGVEMSHNFLGAPEDCLWTPADWAWIGGLFDVLMPGLALGVPVVARRFDKFTAEAAIETIAQGRVRNVFLPPTALRMMRAAGVTAPGLRSVASGGESLGAEMLDWGRAAFGLTINEFYGQTECNMVASSCADLFDPRAGAIGKPVPGFDLAVLDDDGQPISQDGTEGDIALHRGTPSMMLHYWNRPDATAEKFKGDWMLTGDRGFWRDGFIHFKGRDDDVISSAGYRIGPTEIEDCLLKHPAVASAGVIGVPDDLRGQIVVAYVTLRAGFAPDNDLAAELQAFARTQGAAHSYPRKIEFTDALPMTVTGKVIRADLRRLAAAAAEENKAPLR